jgi:hypothetical protein
MWVVILVILGVLRRLPMIDIDLSIIYVGVRSTLPCLRIILGHLIISWFIHIFILCHFLISKRQVIYTFSAFNITNIWGSWIYNWRMLIIVLISFLVIYRCRNYHVGSCSGLSFLSTWYDWKVLTCCLLILMIVCILLLCRRNRNSILLLTMLDLKIWYWSCILICLPVVLRILPILLLFIDVHPVFWIIRGAILSKTMSNMSKHNLFSTLSQVTSDRSLVFNHLCYSPPSTLLL